MLNDQGLINAYGYSSLQLVFFWLSENPEVFGVSSRQEEPRSQEEEKEEHERKNGYY